MTEDQEIERIKARRLQQWLAMQQQAAIQQQIQQQVAQAELEARKRLVLRAILSSDARERLERIRMARPEFAQALENQLIALYQAGRIRAQIDDQMLKQLLAQIVPPKREIRIWRA